MRHHCAAGCVRTAGIVCGLCEKRSWTAGPCHRPAVRGQQAFDLSSPDCGPDVETTQARGQGGTHRVSTGADGFLGTDGLSVQRKAKRPGTLDDAECRKLSDNHSPLAQVPALYRETYGQRLSYSMLWRLACEGEIPVTRVSGRMFMDKADLSRLAEVLDRRRDQRRQQIAA